MGKASTPILPASKRQFLGKARSRGIAEGHTQRYTTSQSIAFELGRNGQPCPAWISTDLVLGRCQRTGEQVEKPGAYLRAFKAGEKQRDKYALRLAEKRQEEQLRQLIRDMGLPYNRDTLEWLKRESKGSMLGR